MELFTVENIYDTEISPLMKKIIAICKEHDITMLSSFIYENDEERGVGYCTTTLNAKGPRHSESLSNALSEIKRGPDFLAMTITVKGGN